MTLTVAASALLMTWNMLAVRPDMPFDTIPAVNDSIGMRVGMSIGSNITGIPYPRALVFAPDTVQQQRQKAISYSDGYYTRLTWHRRLSWAMLPLFAASYVSGDQLLSKGSDAPKWARTIHGPAATGSAVLFGANTFTGAWNLWEGRQNADGRLRRITHALLFTAASGGFVYAGTQLATEAQESQAKRQEHRNVALTSMGVSTASWLLMVFGN